MDGVVIVAGGARGGGLEARGFGLRFRGRVRLGVAVEGVGVHHIGLLLLFGQHSGGGARRGLEDNFVVVIVIVVVGGVFIFGLLVAVHGFR